MNRKSLSHCISSSFRLCLIFHILISSSFTLLSLAFDISISKDFYNQPDSIVSFCLGGYHSCALFSNKQMKCWGQKYAWGMASSRYVKDYQGDEMNELAQNLTVVNVGSNANIDKVSCGNQHICTKLDSGDMKCLGWNEYGQIGFSVPNVYMPIGAVTGHDGDNLPIVKLGKDIKVKDIVLGAQYSCALMQNNNKLKCFGNNAFGQLGYGDTIDRGIADAHMGDNLPFIDLGNGVEISSVHSGPVALHNCAILSQPALSAQRVKCWGYNGYHQLGYGDKNHRGDASGEMGDNLPLLDLGIESKVKQIALGYAHTCILLASNELKCWGSEKSGSLGSGSTYPIKSTGNSLPTVTIDAGKKVKHVTAGDYFTCISYDDDATMKCFGDNKYGQLGQGDADQRGNSIETIIPKIPAINLGSGYFQKISAIYSGAHHNCVLFSDQEVKCFGLNDVSQLGIGSTVTAVGYRSNEMGAELKSTMLHAPAPRVAKESILVACVAFSAAALVLLKELISYCKRKYQARSNQSCHESTNRIPPHKSALDIEGQNGDVKAHRVDENMVPFISMKTPIVSQL